MDNPLNESERKLGEEIRKRLPHVKYAKSSSEKGKIAGISPVRDVSRLDYDRPRMD